MRKQNDLVVIGAGPAGTAAAITAAKAGLCVTIVERSAFPRHRPGETLHPGIEPLLRQLGVWETVEQQGFLRHAGMQVRSNGHTRLAKFGSDANGQWLGLQAWRAEFDQLLLQRARELGVRIRQPCAVASAILRDGRVVGVESDQGRILADFTIDAAGSRHWLANELHLPMQMASPKLVARYGYVEGDFAEAHDAPILIADDNGWTWMARVRERTYQWTRLALCHGSENVSRPSADESPIELRSLTPTGHTCGADVTWRCVSAPAGPGYFLCGDAAAVLDPASSHGVLKGVMSGIYAGHLIEQVKSFSKSEDEAATEYSDWLTRWFRHDVEALQKHYQDMGLSFDEFETPTPRLSPDRLF